jgi:DNA-binding NarL/FixJ family response regulator
MMIWCRAMNVLIAEDNAAYRQSLHRVLAGRFPFMRITEAVDGVEALHQALSRQYDLIFMDIRLPQGNGLDLTRAIKAVFVGSKICVITSYDLPEYREAAFRNGADRFMVKGDSTGEEIVAMVESLLRGRYRALVIVTDRASRAQLAALLAIRWPTMIVAEAASAFEGLAQARAIEPDLVLLDLRLPNIPLPELVQAIKEASRQAKFIGMTTDGQQARQARQTGAGLDYFVPLGPDSYTELAAVVHALQQAELPR